MHIAIVTAEGFNELDSFIALGILNRVRRPGWRVSICAPSDTVTSMNGVTVHAQSRLGDAVAADAVLFGSGMRTREFVADENNLAALALDPARQLIGAQCSGTLVLARLGLLRGIPACTDLVTRPWVVEAGVEVLAQPFFAAGNVATAGGCLSSQYLATWVIARTEGLEAARIAMHYVAPVGEKDSYVARALAHVQPYLPADATTGRAPFHAHVYFELDDRERAERLHRDFARSKGDGAFADLLYVGELRDRPVGPHPKPQFEIHFLARALPAVSADIRRSGLRALVHPLTDDDLADHTTLATWIGEPLALDESVLDPPGRNQGVARFGKSDF